MAAKVDAAKANTSNLARHRGPSLRKAGNYPHTEKWARVQLAAKPIASVNGGLPDQREP